MGCFMPEGRNNILFGSTREKNYCLVSEMKKKNSLPRKKNHSPPYDQIPKMVQYLQEYQ